MNQPASVLYDKNIREPLFWFLELKYGKVRFMEEVPIRRSRADVMMVLDGELIGVEIKSDADGYARLPGQVVDYDRFFDRNYLVVGTKHAYSVLERVPAHWGVITAEYEKEKVDFYLLREAAENPFCQWAARLELLWKSELFRLLDQNRLPKYRQKSKRFIRGKLIEKADAATLIKQTSEELFEREYTL